MAEMTDGTPATGQADGPVAPRESVRDTLERAFRETMPDPATRSGSEPAPAPTPEADATTEPAPPKEQPRDELGRWAAKPAETETGTTPKPAADTVAMIEAPADWPAPRREVFAKLPPEARQELLGAYRDMQADYTKKTQEIAEVRRQYEPLKPVLDGITADLNAHRQAGGEEITVPVWIANAHNWHRVLADPSQRQAAFRHLAQVYGVDIAGLVPVQPAAATAATTDEYVDPQLASLRQAHASEIAALRQEIAALKQPLGAIHQKIMTREQQEAAVQEQRTRQIIDDFKAKKDEAGNPAYPWFDDLRGHMHAILPVIINELPSATEAELLDAAYQRAAWATPATRAQLTASRQKAEAAQRDARARQDGMAAAAASLSITGMPAGSGAPPFNPKATVRETLEAMAAKLAGRL